MFFQNAKTVRGMTLKDNKPLIFLFGSKRNINVTLRKFTEDELKGKNPNDLLCLTIISKEPSPLVQTLFNKLSKGEFGESNLGSEWLLHVEEGRATVKKSEKPSSFPEELMSFSDQISRELNGYAKRTMQVLRWRLNATSYQNPFVNSWTPLWSFDYKNWEVLPSSEIMHASVQRHIQLFPEIQHEITNLIDKGIDEPLAHSLLREAYDHQGTNPRSSLLTGIAAAEIGVKHLISKLLPDTKWMLENLPSPPLTLILTEYFPQLLAQRKIKRKNQPIPKDIIDTIKKGVALRNSVAHTGIPDIKFDTLNNILHSVEDLLWILDYYSGYDWALNYISPEVRAQFKE